AAGQRAERRADLARGGGKGRGQSAAGGVAHALRLGAGRGADLAGHSRRVVNASRLPPSAASVQPRWRPGKAPSALRVGADGPFRRYRLAPYRASASSGSKGRPDLSTP